MVVTHKWPPPQKTKSGENTGVHPPYHRCPVYGTDLFFFTTGPRATRGKVMILFYFLSLEFETIPGMLQRLHK